MPVTIRPKTKTTTPNPTKQSTPYVMVLGSGKGMQKREDVERANQPRQPSIRVVPK
jgi:hypothetical protein